MLLHILVQAAIIAAIAHQVMVRVLLIREDIQEVHQVQASPVAQVVAAVAEEAAVALVAVAAEEAVAPSVVTDSQFLIIRC